MTDRFRAELITIDGNTTVGIVDTARGVVALLSGASLEDVQAEAADLNRSATGAGALIWTTISTEEDA